MTNTEETTNIANCSNKIPKIGSLVCPRHQQNNFETILTVDTKEMPGEDSQADGPGIRLMFLRLSDNKKITTPWYKNCRVFWKYYEEK
jgi:hypothetical protein